MARHNQIVCIRTTQQSLHTHDVRWYNCSTLLYIRTMEANNALPYPRRTDVRDSVSVVKSFKKAAVAFSKDLMLSVSRRQIEDIRV